MTRRDVRFGYGDGPVTQAVTSKCSHRRCPHWHTISAPYTPKLERSSTQTQTLTKPTTTVHPYGYDTPKLSVTKQFSDTSHLERASEAYSSRSHQSGRKRQCFFFRLPLLLINDTLFCDATRSGRRNLSLNDTTLLCAWRECRFSDVLPHCARVSDEVYHY